MKNSNLNKKIIKWGVQSLSSQGYALQGIEPEMVQDTPWSYVVRFSTSDGYIYLKHMPKQLALEADITKILHDQFHACVPSVIASNPELNCFLMKDAGRQLRGILKQKFDTTLLCKAIDMFTSLQVAVADHIALFLDMGVPDWRLEQLPDLYMQLLSQKDVLIADGLSEIEIRELKTLLPKLIKLCKQLSDYSIKQTMVQCDFHDNNILVDEAQQKITFIDLGEIVISHPFFSLISCLRQMKTHHGLTDADDTYQQLLNACLENFLPFGSKKQLSDAFAVARILWFLYESLGQNRLRVACDKARFTAFQRHGRLSGQLKELMNACIPL